MKKYLLSTALLILACLGAKAQFSLGVKAGADFSEISANNFNESTVAGYQLGAFARFGSSVYLQPELYLASSGGKLSATVSGLSYSDNVKFTTLNVPLLIGKRFGGSVLNFRIMAGPVYSYVMSQGQSFSSNFNAAYNNFGNFNNSTLGFQAGAGIDIGLFTVDLRYEGGLTKINPNYGQRQNLWALSIGYKFL